MRATSVMLADAASVRESLLHVLGGGVTRLVRDPLPAPMEVVLALIVEADDVEDYLKQHALEVTIRHGETQVARAVMTLERPGDAAVPPLLPPSPIVVPLQRVPLSAYGRHEIIVSLDRAPVATIRFEVLKTPEPAPD